MTNNNNIKLYCFGSGSSGNCYYLKIGSTGIIIDVGISHRRLKKYFGDYGLSMAEIRAILVTHTPTMYAQWGHSPQHSISLSTPVGKYTKAWSEIS